MKISEKNGCLPDVLGAKALNPLKKQEELLRKLLFLPMYGDSSVRDLRGRLSTVVEMSAAQSIGYIFLPINNSQSNNFLITITSNLF